MTFTSCLHVFGTEIAIPLCRSVNNGTFTSWISRHLLASSELSG